MDTRVTMGGRLPITLVLLAILAIVVARPMLAGALRSERMDKVNAPNVRREDVVDERGYGFDRERVL